MLADVSSLGYTDSDKASLDILKRIQVATVPGTSFYENKGDDGKMLVRFCFAKEYEVLKEACKRIKGL